MPLRLLTLLLLLLPLPALAADVLTCVSQNTCGSAGGASALDSGATGITDGNNTSVCFADGSPNAVLNCEETGLTYIKAVPQLSIISPGLGINGSGAVGFLVANTTDSTAIATQQWPPYISFFGSAWDTGNPGDPAAANSDLAAYISMETVSGGDPYGILKLEAGASVLTLNGSTGAVSSTTFVGGLTGDVTGNVTGNAGSADVADAVDMGGTDNFGLLAWNISQVPASAAFWTGAASNAFIVGERADRAFDFAHPLQTDPTLFIHSRNQSTTQWLSATHDGTDGVIATGAGNLKIDLGTGDTRSLVVKSSANTGVIDLGTTYTFRIRGDQQSSSYFGVTAVGAGTVGGFRFGAPAGTLFQVGKNATGSNAAGENTFLSGGWSTGTAAGGDVALRTTSKTTSGSTVQLENDRVIALGKWTDLTEGVATSFARVATPSNSAAGGWIKVTVEANDGTDFQARSLEASYSIANKAGVLTETLGAIDSIVAASIGTLVCTLSMIDAGSGNADFQLDCASSLGAPPAVLRANAVVIKNMGSGAVTAQ